MIIFAATNWVPIYAWFYPGDEDDIIFATKVRINAEETYYLLLGNKFSKSQLYYYPFYGRKINLHENLYEKEARYPNKPSKRLTVNPTI